MYYAPQKRQTSPNARKKHIFPGKIQVGDFSRRRLDKRKEAGEGRNHSAFAHFHLFQSFTENMHTRVKYMFFIRTQKLEAIVQYIITRSC